MGLEGQIFGDFEILEKLGEGGMGAVYKARQTLLGRMTALKVMAYQYSADPTFVARFFREASAAANLSHPNMVEVYKCGEEEGLHYIAMEYVEGESLHDRLVRVGALDARQAIAVTVYVGQALQYAWNKAHLIHRDIKPDNIFLSNTGEVKVGDLGLAKVVGGQSVELTRTGMMVGSPHYVSPEQARALKDIDFRTDMYSLGCTLYHMLTGRTPYEGDDAVGVMMHHVNDPPPAIFRYWPQCPVPLALVLGRMMAKDKTARHPSYEVLLDELLAIHDKLRSGVAPGPLSPPHPPVPTPARAVPSPSGRVRSAPRGAVKPALPMPVLGVAIALAVGAAGLLLWAPWKPQAPASSAAPTAGIEDVFVQEVAALPVEEQIVRVLEALKERNPGFDAATADYRIESGQVVEMSFDSSGLSDISAVAALKQLRALDCSGRQGAESELRDLTSLSGLPLMRLRADRTAVTDLAPLRGMPLRELFLAHAPVSDLSPLGGMGLETLDLCGTPVADLAPLANLPLGNLHLHDCPAVCDLSPLRGMKLAFLCFAGTQVDDLSPLRGMPLRNVVCNAMATRSEANRDVLRSIPTLESINAGSAATFLAQVDAGRIPETPAGPDEPGQFDGVSVAESAGGETIPHPRSRKTREVVLSDGTTAAVPEGMVLVPAGPFLMGNDGGSPVEFPAHEVGVAAFCIDKFEVTNAEYLEFVKATGRAMPKHWTDNGGRIPRGRGSHPVTHVSWEDAKAYCDWCGKRLPTEAEWEKAAGWDAARGVKCSSPWGAGGDRDPNQPRANWAKRWVAMGEQQKAWDEFTKTDEFKAQMALGGPTMPVGSFPLGASPSGCVDMAGNAWEWTADWFDKYPGNARTLDPVDASQCGRKARVLRGVTCDCHPLSGGVLSCTNRRGHAPNWRRWHIGFRCALDCPPQPEAVAR